MSENDNQAAAGAGEAAAADAGEASAAGGETAAEAGAMGADAAGAEASGSGEGAAGSEADAGGADAAPPAPPEEITYHAVEKDGQVTAIWEMQGRKHLRTIDPRSRQGLEILRLYTAEHSEHQ
ncbi:MAG TPA: hypothetical protein VEQ42_12890 [Pyrinomonadaceae bacterium]|nr:hypothetical protein [Pyrinomonadaceae bacterium]